MKGSCEISLEHSSLSLESERMHPLKNKETEKRPDQLAQKAFKEVNTEQATRTNYQCTLRIWSMDFNNLLTEVAVSPIPTLIHNIHPQSQILGDPKSSVQTRSRVKQTSGAHALVSYVQKQQRNNHKDQQHWPCLPASYLMRNLQRFLKLLKMTVELKLCKNDCLYFFGCNEVMDQVDLPHKEAKESWKNKNSRQKTNGIERE
ncbi:hypothetical protein Tco_0820943 [Tanacetum coccineum]|uniref:Uncharacterized protein n=1 Tax=Tanacetum coccineum TaxID=301880 RepID=A0ABQ5AF61_9ASTR